MSWYSKVSVRSPVSSPSARNFVIDPMNRLFAACALIVCFILSSRISASQTQSLPSTTQEIFKQYSEHVVKIEVVETGSAAKASTGTGFYADGSGRIVTNYHVIS